MSEQERYEYEKAIDLREELAMCEFHENYEYEKDFVEEKK